MKLSTNFRKLFLVVTLLTVAINTHAQSTITAEIPVSYDVSASGAFQYTIPLRIPPGIKDMVPSLAINYNSQSGDGNLGMGWSLSGLSAITRGMPTIYHDQAMGAVDFNADDVFFLDGQRLFWETSTSTYLTEVKNFATIKSWGTAGAGPSYFTVEYPNGMVAEYGNSTSSKMFAQGKSDVLMWPVNKITDVHGNYITFEYINSPSSGEYRILQIVYGQNSATSNGIPVTIDFNYNINRQYPNKAFVKGSEVLNNKLLSDITIKFSNWTPTGPPANKYKFTYGQSGVHPRLTKIEELRDGTNVMAPIEINWGTYSETYNDNVTTTNVGSPNRSVMSGDFNGDGLSDFVAFHALGSNNQMMIYLNDHKNNPGNFIQAQSMTVVFYNIVYAPTRLAFDYDGDGRDDVILLQKGQTPGGAEFINLLLLRANGNPTTVFDSPVSIHYSENTSNNNSNFANDCRFIPGDFDGDGKSEIIIIEPHTFHNNGLIDYHFRLAGFHYTSWVLNHFEAHTIFYIAGIPEVKQAMALDNDGDGRDEFTYNTVGNPLSSTGRLKLTYSGTTPQLIQTPTSWPIDWLGTTTFPNANYRTWPGDFNGDGKTDIISWDEVTTGNPWSLAYGDGLWPFYTTNQVVTSTSHPLSNLHIYGPGQTSNGDYSYFLADFNGDGLTDILQLYRDVVNVQCDFDIFYSTGGSFTHQTFYSLQVDADERHTCLGDFNGDGQLDMLCGRVSGNMKYVTFRRNDGSMKVASIEHIGKTISTEYQTIPQDAEYVKIQPASSDFMARTLSMKVVKRMYDGVDLDKSYTYKGLLYHKYGLGIRGFKEFIVKNAANQKIYQTFELESTIPYLNEQKVFDALGSLDYGSKTTYQQFDFPGGANGKSHIIINSPLKVTDNIGGSATITTITTGSTSPGTVFYDFGKVESVSKRTKNLIGGLNGLQTTTYNYGSNWATLKGKPESVTVYSDIDPTGANSITRTTEYAYYSNGDLQTVKTDPGTMNETVTDYQYDYQNTIYPYGHVVQTDLNANGVPGTVTNEYTYTTDGKFLASKVNPMGYTTTYNYGNLAACWGNVLSKTNYKGLQTQYTYDPVNRLVKETDVFSSIEMDTDYDWASSSPHAASLTGAHLVVSTSNSYDVTAGAKVLDIYGRTLREVSLGGIYVDYTYDANGQVKTVMGPYDSFAPIIVTATTTYTYDVWGRETERSTDNGGPVIQTSYSVDLGTGLLHTTVSNQGANTWKKSITCGSTLRSVVSSGTPNHTIDYTYHGNGTLATTKVNNGSGSGKTFTNTVDAYGRVTANSQPNAGTVSYAYDALDRVITETRASGTVYQYDYDLLGRVLEKHMSGASQPYTYTYENTNGIGSTGELEQETSPNGHVKDYTYHPEGWLHSVKEDNFFETIYMYHPNGDLKHYTFNNDLTIEYSYYQAGIVQEATLISGLQFPLPLGHQTLWMGWWLNPHGQRHGAYYFNTSNTPAYADKRTYDVHGLLERHEMINAGLGINVVDNRYSFDIHTGNLNWRKDDMPGRNHTEYFTYDNHYDQLKTVSQSIGGGPAAQILGMAYDMHGNIKEKDDVAPVLTHQWKYDDYALKTVPMPGAPPFPPTVAIPHFRQDITYTPFEKVESMREDQNNEVFFTYGADDQRVQATYTDLTGGGAGSLQKTKTYYNNYERIDYITGAKDELFYVWAGNELIAILKVFSQPGQPSISNIYYPMRDHLGSITHLMDINWTNGAMANGVVEERSFDAWGRTRDPNNWQPYPIGGHPSGWRTDRGYTGHEHIWMPTFSNFYDNNIINMDGRLYDPLVGRMFSPDPYIPDGTNTQDYNKYIYARNNPLKYNDPDGNFVNFAIGAVVGGFVGYQIGKANGATGWGMAGYIAGGALVGAVTAGVGSMVASGGGIMANTAGIVMSSYTGSMGMTALSGGMIQPSISYGFGSYNLGTREHNYFLDGDNKWYEDVAYGFGAMANLQDLTALWMGTNVTVNAHVAKDDWTGHSSIYNDDGVDISVAGADPFEYKWSEPGTRGQDIEYLQRHIKVGNGRHYTGYPTTGPKIELHNVNGRILEGMTRNLSKGKGLWGIGELNYGMKFGCMNHTARALWGVGIPNLTGLMSISHPLILNAELFIRQQGIYSSSLLLNLD